MKNEKASKKCKAEAVTSDSKQTVAVTKSMLSKKALVLNEPASCTGEPLLLLLLNDYFFVIAASSWRDLSAKMQTKDFFSRVYNIPVNSVTDTVVTDAAC